MNKYKSYVVVFFGLLISSCSVSKKSLINELESLKKVNKSLAIDNDILNEKVINLEIAIEEIKNENIPAVNVSPTLDIKVVSTASQLNQLEQFLRSDNALSAKFRSFKRGGIEKTLRVSYSDMQRVIKEAKTYKGTRHVMGGLSHNGIDCSGLLFVSFKANGITNIPRTAADFARYGSIIINTNELKAGDLVFFTNTYRTSKLVTHAGICIGNGEFIHTSSSKGVMISKINDPYYWRDKFLFGTRIVN